MISFRSLWSHKVVVSSSFWALSGVNIFSANLVRQLRKRGVDAHLLLTEQDTNCVTITDPLMQLPSDIPVVYLPVRREQPWGAHWGAMIRYLETLAPCIYLPNADWRHSSISPYLSNRVGIVGVVHSDDPLHYDHVKRLGAYWNAIVAVSARVAEKTKMLVPSLQKRIKTIPIGVEIPAIYPIRDSSPQRPLNLFYHGLLIQRQKRILDLPRIVEKMKEGNVPVHLTIAGGGDQEVELLQHCAPLIEEGAIRFAGMMPHEEILKFLQTQDVFLMTSEFEGMPNAMLEAMGAGCIPVVTKTESGIPEVIRDGKNGFLIDVGDMNAFRETLTLLYKDVQLRDRISREASNTIRNGPYNLAQMADSYIGLFRNVMFKSFTGMYHRPKGPIASPPYEVDGINILPMEYPFEAPGVGKFHSEYDYQEFYLEIAKLKETMEANKRFKPVKKAIRKFTNTITGSQNPPSRSR